MSYENTVCPCGGKKEPQTMLCEQCVKELADTTAMQTFKDDQSVTELRRHAAIVLISQARGLGRKRVVT